MAQGEFDEFAYRLSLAYGDVLEEIALMCDDWFPGKRVTLKFRKGGLVVDSSADGAYECLMIEAGGVAERKQQRN
jgi:hypothetical protein